jgi:hypothetical protein
VNDENDENEERISTELSGEGDSDTAPSPDPFSCYKMQQRLNKICMCAQFFCLTLRVHPKELGTNGEQNTEERP